MPNYQTPGVYKEEILPAAAAEFYTGVPAFLGYASGKHLFSAKGVFQSDLDRKSVPDSLVRAFEINKTKLSESVTISVEQESARWLLEDKTSHQKYLIIKIDTEELEEKESKKQESEKKETKQQKKDILDIHAWVPANTPYLLTTWSQFEETFGHPLPGGYLAYAVRGFFENDGNRCYVIRLYDHPLDDKSIRERLKTLKNGLKTLEAFDRIDLICSPDIMREYQDEDKTWQSPSPDGVHRMQKVVLNHCDNLNDRFAILDSLYGETVVQVIEHKSKIISKNGALYYPWIKVINGPPHKDGFIPPCGHIAGIYARNDLREGPHKAPANEILEGALDLNRRIKDTDQDQLNPEGINCLRTFAGRGIRVWGARSLAQKNDTQWRYINVRRLFMTVERWIERNMPDIVFEPNNQRLWARITRELGAYFRGLLLSGALKGRTVEEAFYVKCDQETNSPQNRESGRVITEIGLAPTVPNEFVVVRIIQSTSGLTVAGP